MTTALERGHQVTAFGRSVDRLDTTDEALEVCKGDVFDSESVSNAVGGHDAAIVCLGSTGLRDKAILAAGTKTVIDAMVIHGADRVVVMSAAGVGDSWKQIPWSSRLLFRTLFRNVFADHQAQEATVKQSPLDWTIARAAVLKDDPATGTYSEQHSQDHQDQSSRRGCVSRRPARRSYEYWQRQVCWQRSLRSIAS